MLGGVCVGARVRLYVASHSAFTGPLCLQSTASSCTILQLSAETHCIPACVVWCGVVCVHDHCRPLCLSGWRGRQWWPTAPSFAIDYTAMLIYLRHGGPVTGVGRPFAWLVFFAACH